MLKRLLGEDIELVTLLDPEFGTGEGRRRPDGPGHPESCPKWLVTPCLREEDSPWKREMSILQEEYAQKHFSLRPGSYVMLAISDIGCGMDAEDPFPHFRAFLHHQGTGKGNRLGTFNGVRHYSAERRLDLGLQRAWAWN